MMVPGKTKGTSLDFHMNKSYHVARFRVDFMPLPW